MTEEKDNELIPENETIPVSNWEGRVSLFGISIALAIVALVIIIVCYRVFHG